MQNLQIGRISYGIGIAGIGALQFVYPGFRPVLLPISVGSDLNILVYLLGLALVLAGLYIAFGKSIKTVALSLGLGLLLLFVFGQLPNLLSKSPEVLASWINPLKLLALSGGAFMTARLFPSKISIGLLKSVDKISPYGKYFFGIMLVVFGFTHFVYTDFVKTLVPAWIPGPLLWAYVTGVALIGAGVAILIHFKPRQISLLLALMLYIWLLVLHIPRAVIATAADNGNEWTSVFQCLAFAGMALLWPHLKKS